MDYPFLFIFAGILLTFLSATLVGRFIANTGFPLPPSERRIGCVDGLRGYLALAVMAHHFVIWMQVRRLGGSWAAPSFDFFNQLGPGGVALFFMTTGLVFYPRVLGGWRACSWSAIYISRLFRLIPLVAVSVALITLVIMSRTGSGLDSGYPWAVVQWLSAWGEPPLLGYSDSGRLNAYVLWSLKYEWVFYLAVLPACALAMDRVRKADWPSWVVPVGLLSGAVLLKGGVHLGVGPDLPGISHGADHGLPAYVPCFAIGMLAYECQTNNKVVSLLKKRGAAIAAVASLAFAMSAFPVPYAEALPMYGFFFICVACGNDFGGIFHSRGALVLGECSYGIYLMHGIALSLLYVDLPALVTQLPVERLPLLIPVVALVVVPFTALTYLLIERPAIRLGKRVARGWRLQKARIEAGVSVD